MGCPLEGNRSAGGRMGAESIEEWRVRPVYQPIVALGTGGVVGYEALARGVADSGALEMPHALFARADREGSLEKLDLACWEAAIGGALRARLLGGSHTLLFVNVLPDTIVAPGFVEWALDVLAEHGVPSTRLVLELNEGRRIDDYARVRDAADRLRESGFLIAVDDAGTGHAGLQTLAELRPDLVKIDQSLVRGVDRDAARRAILEMFVVLADRLGARLVAEGIETAAELGTVVRLGVELGQGYYLARPVVNPVSAGHEERVAARVAKVMPVRRAGQGVGDGASGTVEIRDRVVGA